MLSDEIVINIITKNEEEEAEQEEDKTLCFKHRSIVQIFIAFLVVSLAVIGVVTADEPYKMKDIYIAVGSAIIGLYLPNPKLK